MHSRQEFHSTSVGQSASTSGREDLMVGSRVPVSLSRSNFRFVVGALSRRLATQEEERQPSPVPVRRTPSEERRKPKRSFGIFFQTCSVEKKETTPSNRSLTRFRHVVHSTSIQLFEDSQTQRTQRTRLTRRNTTHTKMEHKMFNKTEHPKQAGFTPKRSKTRPD